MQDFNFLNTQRQIQQLIQLPAGLSQANRDLSQPTQHDLIQPGSQTAQSGSAGTSIRRGNGRPNFPGNGFGHGGFGGANMYGGFAIQMMMSFMVQMMQQMFSLLQNVVTQNNTAADTNTNNDTSNDVDTPDVADDTDYTPDVDQDVDEPYVADDDDYTPDVDQDVDEPTYPPCEDLNNNDICDNDEHYEEPPCEDLNNNGICDDIEDNTPKVRGSAGLFGDPKLGLFTPDSQIQGVPPILREFDSGLAAGQTVTVLDDPDNDHFAVSVNTVQVDPANADSVGVGSANINFGPVAQGFGDNEIIVNNDGTVHVRFGDAIDPSFGNINDGIAKQTISHGVTIETAVRDGETKLIVNNGEYEVALAMRSPHPDSSNYFDINFEELTADAADNATGHDVQIGDLGAFGIDELLGLEQADINALG